MSKTPACAGVTSRRHTPGVTAIICATLLATIGHPTAMPPATAAPAVTAIDPDVALIPQPAPAENNQYYPTGPHRVVDTRPAADSTTTQQPAPANPATRLTGGSVHTITFVGDGSDVPDNATAVVVNITAVNPQASGSMAMFPSSLEWPGNTTLSFTAGQDTAGMTILGLSPEGTARLRTSATTDVVIDVVGYFIDNAGYTPVAPHRFLDTPARGADGKTPARTTEPADLSGQLPDTTPVRGAMVSVTTEKPTADGYLTIYSGGASRPLASMANYLTGETRTANTLVQPGPDNTIQSYTHSKTHQIGNLLGYFPETSTFRAAAPLRVIDTRMSFSRNKVPAGVSQSIHVTGRGRIPTDGVRAAVVSITATEPDAAGYLSAWGTNDNPTKSTVLTFQPNQTIANTAIVPVAEDGTITIRSTGKTHLIVDALGYFG